MSLLFFFHPQAQGSPPPPDEPDEQVVLLDGGGVVNKWQKIRALQIDGDDEEIMGIVAAFIANQRLH